MQIVEVLIQLPMDRLYTLAKHWGVAFRKSTNGHQDTETIHAVEAAYSDPIRVITTFKRCSAQQQEVLYMVYSLLPSYPSRLPYQEAVKKLRQLAKQKGLAESLISELETAGLLFRFYMGRNDYVLIPQQISTTLELQIALQLIANIEREGAVAGNVKVLENRGLSFYHDLMTILGSIANEKIEVSQKGHIYKRTAVKLISKLRSSSDRFPTFFDNDGLDKQIHFFEKFLGHIHLVRFHTFAQIKMKGTERFLSTHYADWAVMLFEFYLTQINRPKNISLTLLSILIGKIGIGQWVRSDAISEQLDKQFSKWNIRITPEQIRIMCFDPLIMLGLIQWGQDEQGNEVWQWTAWGREFVRITSGLMRGESSKLAEMLSTDVFVQPNMEIMIPENIIPAIRWKIEALAELKQADAVLIYEVTKKRILNAMECGWTLESIREFLGTFSKVPVADNVYQTIRGWIGNYGIVEIWDVMVVQVKNTQAAEWMRSDKLLSKLVVASFSPQAFVIQRTDQKQVRERMAKLGYPIPWNIVRVDPEGEGRRDQFVDYSTDGSAEEKIARMNSEALAPQKLLGSLSIEEVALRFITLDDLDEILNSDYFEDDYDDDEEDEDWDPFSY